MTRWQETPFADILVDSKDGEWGQGEETVGHQLTEVIRGTDFHNLNNPTKELPKRWIKNHIVERKKLQPRDVLLETAGGTATQSTGRSALLRKTFFEKHSDHPVLCSSFTRYLRLNHKSYCPEFIFYLLQALYKAGYMAVYNLQHTGVSRFQYTTFKNKTVLKLPSLEIQERVAAILSAYDDLIENNRRRIALLEKMAEEIYREWFVRMRFPGHEKVKFEKGVPEGWEKKRLGEFCMLQRGFDLPDSQVVAGEYPVIASTSIKTYHNQYKVKPPVITTGRSGSLGKVLFTNSKAWPLNTSLFVKNFFGNSPYLIYYTLKNMGLENFNSGAGVPSLNRNHINGIPLAVPSEVLQEEFDNKIDSLFKQPKLIEMANDNLTKSRDMLLSRLISGALPVENLDIQFPPSMLDETEGEGTVASAKDTTNAQLHLRRRHREGNTKEAKA